MEFNKLKEYIRNKDGWLNCEEANYVLDNLKEEDGYNHAIYCPHTNTYKAWDCYGDCLEFTCKVLQL